MSNTAEKQTLEDAFNSLTGFDEIAIEKRFGLSDYSTIEQRSTRWVRAMVFVLKRREGLNDLDAYKTAMDMTLGELNDQFAEDEDDETDRDFDPENPVSELGKDDSQSGAEPTSSQPGASSPANHQTSTTSSPE